ncbi:hypothetical protein RJ639_033505 [Escallonia herrerae]|uniref:N-alpha-acetyltransferase 40 n=1 Tax=Escallonia herrerae TaxID=1293975 RepID=A0AA89BL73_9ASTE|nr:hypothetical protein RJ639_033505 [Escallonia herrerae]
MGKSPSLSPNNTDEGKLFPNSLRFSTYKIDKQAARDLEKERQRESAALTLSLVGNAARGTCQQWKQDQQQQQQQQREDDEKERGCLLLFMQILEKKKSVDQIVKSASAPNKDHLSSFPTFRHHNKSGIKSNPLSSTISPVSDIKYHSGLCLYLAQGRGDKLSSRLKHYVKGVLKANMEGPYGSEWPAEEKVKHREMVAPEAHYIFVHEAAKGNANQMSEFVEISYSAYCVDDRDPIVGFVHYRFTTEEELPVLYVYELQLEPCVQRKGLGEFLMQLIELIAHKNRMDAVVLTVQKENMSALNFYINKMR